MKNFTEDLGITGHLEIIKKLSSGEEEVLLDDPNIIVSGMGFGLSYLFTAQGSDSILDYQIDRFQIGLSGPPAGGVVSGINQLSGALSSAAEYGPGSNLFIEVKDLRINSTTTISNQNFALIPTSKITRLGESSVRYTLVIDEEACNNLTRTGSSRAINEAGLFMKNPTGAGASEPVLVAYRTFSDIIKTNDFSLLFRWTLNF